MIMSCADWEVKLTYEILINKTILQSRKRSKERFQWNFEKKQLHHVLTKVNRYYFMIMSCAINNQERRSYRAGWAIASPIILPRRWSIWQALFGLIEVNEFLAILEVHSFKIFRGSIPSEPPEGSRLWRSFARAMRELSHINTKYLKRSLDWEVKLTRSRYL